MRRPTNELRDLVPPYGLVAVNGRAKFSVVVFGLGIDEAEDLTPKNLMNAKNDTDNGQPTYEKNPQVLRPAGSPLPHGTRCSVFRRGKTEFVS